MGGLLKEMSRSTTEINLGLVANLFHTQLLGSHLEPPAGDCRTRFECEKKCVARKVCKTTLKSPFFASSVLFLAASCWGVFSTKKCISKKHLENHRQGCASLHESEEAVVVLTGRSCCSTYSYHKRHKGLGVWPVLPTLHQGSQDLFSVSSDLTG